MSYNQDPVDVEKTIGSGNSKDGHDENKTFSAKAVLPAMVAIYLAVFLVAIDRTIIGTAIPTITSEFNSFEDVAWYEAGFLLPLCALQLSFGRIFRYYSTKWILVSLVAVFEVGSIVCAAAPTSNALIVGRVVSGIGAVGITSGAFLLITLLIPLRSRPKYTGGIGSMFGLASILGPVLGGYLTSVTWRWCFWINVPIGGVALVLLVFLTPNVPVPVKPAETWPGKIKDLDPLGFLLIAPSIICLLFAIEFGGKTYPWNDGRIIALLVVFGVLAIGFIASQIWRGEGATIPPRIFRYRSILAGSAATLGIGSILVLYAFYLPIWFQVVQGKSPQSSGLSLLPLLLSNVLAVIGGGIAISMIGYYTPFMIAGGAFAVVGSALITTWQVDIDTGKWTGFQIVMGFGLGLVLQGPNIAAQTVLSDSDVSIGLSLLQFISFLGGTVFVTASQSLLQTRLTEGLQDILPNFDPSLVANGGATSLRNAVSEEQLPVVLDVYNDSIRAIWYLGLGLSCFVFVSAFGFEWKSVKTEKNNDKQEEKTTDEVVSS